MFDVRLSIYFNKRGIPNCFIKTKPSNAKIAEMNLYSPQANKTFSRKKASPTNPRDASHAAMPEKITEDLHAKCSMLSALHAAELAKFLSSRGMTVRYIAASASQGRDNFPSLY